MLSFFKHLRVRKLSSFISVLKLVWRSNGATSHKIWGVFEDCRIFFFSSVIRTYHFEKLL